MNIFKRTKETPISELLSQIDRLTRENEWLRKQAESWREIESTEGERVYEFEVGFDYFNGIHMTKIRADRFTMDSGALRFFIGDRVIYQRNPVNIVREIRVEAKP